MRTTVTLDDDVFEAASHIARTTGKRLGKVLSTLARRFPVFDVPENALVIPASRLQQAIDEESLC